VTNSPVHFVFAVITLVFGAAAEELLPKPCSVGFPVLLASVQFFSVRRPVLPAAMFAIVAGAFEDALSSLPVMTSISFFLSVTLLTRWCDLPRGVSALTYPLYQVWLIIWVSGLAGNVFSRILVSVPVGLVTAFVVGGLLAWLKGGVALDDEE